MLVPPCVIVALLTD